MFLRSKRCKVEHWALCITCPYKESGCFNIPNEYLLPAKDVAKIPVVETVATSNRMM